MAQTAPAVPQPPALSTRIASPGRRLPSVSPTLAFDNSRWAPRSAGSSAASGTKWRMGDTEPFPKHGSTALYTSSEPDSWRRRIPRATQDPQRPADPERDPSPRKQANAAVEGSLPISSLEHGQSTTTFSSNPTRRPIHSNTPTGSSFLPPSTAAFQEHSPLGPQRSYASLDYTPSWPTGTQANRASRPSNSSATLSGSFFAHPPASVGSIDSSYGSSTQPFRGPTGGQERLCSAFHSFGLSDNASSVQRSAVPLGGSSILPPVSGSSARPGNLSDHSFLPRTSPHQSGFIDFNTREAGSYSASTTGGRAVPNVSQRASRPSDQDLRPEVGSSNTWHTPDMRGQTPWRESRLAMPYQDPHETLPPVPLPFHPNFTPGGPALHPFSVDGLSQYGQQHIAHAGLSMTKDVTEPSASLRSPCLADFRNSGGKNSKRWELKDIYNHVVEFSGDHHGSLFIQSKLEKAKTEEKEVLFREIQPNAVPLMKDVFGNYVLQKFFEHGDHLQKKILVNSMRGQVPELSKHVYGCRVVQTAFNHILVEQQAALVKELESCVMECVKNENGNHVIQIAIRLVPMQYLQAMIDQFYGHVQHLATHRYGCRIIQRLLESCTAPVLTRLLQELHECTPQLIVDTYGNYVPQHIVQHGELRDRDRIIEVVQRNLVLYSKQKFASNVVEKCVKHGVEEQRRQIMRQLLQQDAHEHNELLCFLIRDGYGNYVIQSLLDHLNDQDYAEFVRALEPALRKAREVSPNKQSENVAKKMQRFKTPRYGWNCPPASGLQFGSYSTYRSCATPQINTQVSDGRLGSSAVTTPPLTTAGTESPVSNAFSTVTDTTRQDSTKEQREWRKDSAINFEDPDPTLKL